MVTDRLSTWVIWMPQCGVGMLPRFDSHSVFVLCGVFQHRKRRSRSVGDIFRMIRARAIFQLAEHGSAAAEFPLRARISQGVALVESVERRRHEKARCLLSNRCTSCCLRAFDLDRRRSSQPMDRADLSGRNCPLPSQGTLPRQPPLSGRGCECCRSFGPPSLVPWSSGLRSYRCEQLMAGVDRKFRKTSRNLLRRGPSLATGRFQGHSRNRQGSQTQSF
jgi:hypothetical protein